MPKPHPRELLLGAQAAQLRLRVCDHYSGVRSRMEKSLQLQSQMTQDLGVCVFDVTLDCEDGAPVGAEKEHAQGVAELVANSHRDAKVAVRIHALGDPHFESDIEMIVSKVGHRLTHVMIPKVECLQDIHQVHACLVQHGAKDLPIHALIESPFAVSNAFEIASHPSVQSLSFGLMDFVSAHGGAIPAWAMTMQGQFKHPLMVRAKLEVASACHAFGKTPAHGVVTEIKDVNAIKESAQLAYETMGFTRMWSIHPAQIEPIVKAMSPSADEVSYASEILWAAHQADWGPIQFDHRLHDRASYRFYWQVIERAHATACHVPEQMVSLFFQNQVA
ncbi:MAG: HpcH/HpaI aldolase/citrate lyase family protein [Burkholderiaceae bacterium]